jgi:ribosomal protein S18 acetylase RimI-like enzyme
MWAKSLETDPKNLVFVAEDDADAVIGFSGAGPARRPEPAADVEIHVIHVLPAYRGHGVGHALWTAACAAARGPELASMYVETIAELAAAGFYRAHGGVLIEERPVQFHGATRTHVAFRWERGNPHA